MNTIKVKLNVNLGNLMKDKIIELGTSKYPLNSYWIHRLKDSEIDNCLTIIKTEEKSNKKSEFKLKKSERLKNGD